LKFTLVTPIHESKKFFNDTFASILNQTYRDWEWIIVGDGCRLEFEPHPQIRYLENEHTYGAGISLNRAFAKARGEYGIIIPADNLYAPDFLETLSQKVNSKKIFYTDFDLIDEKGNKLEAMRGPRVWDKSAFFHWHYVGDSVVFPLPVKRSFWNGAGSYFQYLIALALEGWEFERIPQVKYWWRNIPNNYDASASGGIPPEIEKWIEQNYHPEIYLCTIMKNESENLKKYVAHNISFVDHAIIVDTGSTDDSLKIAQDLGAEVYRKIIKDKGYFHFAKAKNEAIKHVPQGEWFLVLDCDDELSEDFHQLHDESKINKFYDAYCFPCHDAGANEVMQIHWSWRLFKKRPFSYYQNRIHEQPKWLHHEVVNTGGLDWKITHWGYLQAENMDQRFERNRPLLDLALQEDPEDPTLWFNAAIQMQSEKKIFYAIDYWQRTLRLYNMAKQLASVANMKIGECYLMLNEPKKALDFLKQAIQLDPGLADANLYLGQLYRDLWKFSGEERYRELAREHLEKAKSQNTNLVLSGSGFEEKADAVLKELADGT